MVQSTNAPTSSAATASGGTAGPRKGPGAGAVRAKGGATPAIHSASSGEDDPFHWSDAEIRKVAAVRLRLGARASHYQTSFHTPGRTCQEIAALVATSRYADVEASLKRQRAAGESLAPGGKVSGSRVRASGVANPGHSGHGGGGGSGRKDVSDAPEDLPWSTSSSSPGRAEPVPSPGPLVANTSPFRNSPPGHSPPAGDAGARCSSSAVVALSRRGWTQLPLTEPPCHPCSPTPEALSGQEGGGAKVAGEEGSREAHRRNAAPSCVLGRLPSSPSTPPPTLGALFVTPVADPTRAAAPGGSPASASASPSDVPPSADHPFPSPLQNSMIINSNKGLSGFGRARSAAVPAASAYQPWSEAQMRILAQAEAQLPPGERMVNAALAAVYQSRYLDAIKALRRQPRYRAILAEVSVPNKNSPLTHWSR
ncbi:hypothetical protein MTO96_044040 [Rhipicephalus appendiculatus]